MPTQRHKRESQSDGERERKRNACFNTNIFLTNTSANIKDTIGLNEKLESNLTGSPTVRFNSTLGTQGTELFPGQKCIKLIYNLANSLAFFELHWTLNISGHAKENTP